jgi:hypothetical protein
MSVVMCEVTASIRADGRKASAVHVRTRDTGSRPRSDSAASGSAMVAAAAALAVAVSGGRRAPGSSRQHPVRTMNTTKPIDHSRSCWSRLKNGSIRNG